MAVVGSPSSGRRLTSLVAVLALVGAPALVLRVLCVGRSCLDRQASAASVPFCPLPYDVRAAVVAGFRAGRSPDVMATTSGVRVVEPPDRGGAPWPSDTSPDLRVPIAFLGSAVARGSLPAGMGLDQIAPTIAQALGFARAHPEVRAGTPVPLSSEGFGAAAPKAIPLVVEIAWKAVGTADLGSAWPAKTGALVHHDGAGTLAGDAGSLPLDPAATMTTIGTGGLPFQHGITGSMIRDDRGGVRAAWSEGAPTSVISTLADDLAHSFGAQSRVGMVATEGTDRGLIGSGWYLGAEPGELLLASADPSPAVDRLLHQGYGSADGAPDVLGVALRGPVATMDRETGVIVTSVLQRVPRALVVVAGTGTVGSRAAIQAGVERATVVAKAVDGPLGSPVVADSVAGGLFLNEHALDAQNLSADAAVRQMRTLVTPGGAPLFSQVFPAFSVAFSRYC